MEGNEAYIFSFPKSHPYLVNASDAPQELYNNLLLQLIVLRKFSTFCRTQASLLATHQGVDVPRYNK